MISYSQSVQVVPTVQAAAYAAGNVVGGLLTLAAVSRSSGWGGLIQSATATFSSGVTPSLDLILLNAQPTTSTITDNTALAITAADLDNVQGVIHLIDATNLGSTSIVQSQQQALPVKPLSGGSLYAALVARSAFTLGSTSDLTITLQVLQN